MYCITTTFADLELVNGILFDRAAPHDAPKRGQTASHPGAHTALRARAAAAHGRTSARVRSVCADSVRV